VCHCWTAPACCHVSCVAAASSSSAVAYTSRLSRLRMCAVHVSMMVAGQGCQAAALAAAEDGSFLQLLPPPCCFCSPAVTLPTQRTCG
jgi:hypothetical protein